MKNQLRRKKLRKFESIDTKKLLIGVAAILFVSIGFSLIATTLSIRGNTVAKKKNWDAVEVEYTTTYNSTVTNSKEAFEDLYDRITGTYTYTKTAPANGKNDGSTGTWTATYICKNGTATMTSCRYSGTHGDAVCDGGSGGREPTIMCTYSESSRTLGINCNSSLPQNTVYGGGLPSSESCS